MLRNKYIKLAVSVLLVLVALWVAIPKVYIHDLLGHDHSAFSLSSETTVKSQSADDCDFEKYDKPLYFNIFKFISSFIPLRPQNAVEIQGSIPGLKGFSGVLSLLRAPPLAN